MWVFLMDLFHVMSCITMITLRHQVIIFSRANIIASSWSIFFSPYLCLHWLQETGTGLISQSPVWGVECCILIKTVLVIRTDRHLEITTWVSWVPMTKVCIKRMTQKYQSVLRFQREWKIGKLCYKSDLTKPLQYD